MIDIKKLLEEADEVKASHNPQKNGGRSAAICMVNTEKHGKRIKFSNEVMDNLGNPVNVQVKTFNTSIYIGIDLPGATKRFTISKGNHIYSAALVEEITRKFKLDFSERTSIAIGTFKILDLDEDAKVVEIIINEES